MSTKVSYVVWVFAVGLWALAEGAYITVEAGGQITLDSSGGEGGGVSGASTAEIQALQTQVTSLQASFAAMQTELHALRGVVASSVSLPPSVPSPAAPPSPPQAPHPPRILTDPRSRERESERGGALTHMLGERWEVIQGFADN